MTNTAQGSITKDGNTWRVAGKSGCHYLWRNAHGLVCSCPTFRKKRACQHKQRLIAHLTEALAEYAGEM